MNVETMKIEVPYHKAHAAVRDYREALKTKHASEADKQLYAAYRAVAQGKRVIDIADVMQKAGVDATARPKLAICQANATWVYFRLAHRDGPQYWFAPRSVWGLRRPRTTVSLPMDVFPLQTRQFSGRSRVPFIPPQHRPKHQLSGYHILWEAVWESKPPVDPLLLKSLGGPFYAVLAAWDLTPLEQAVMRG